MNYEFQKMLGMHLKIFVSYRRSDSADIVGRIVDHLMMAFGDDSVFHDVDSINAGARFKEDINEAICGSDVFLAVIGDRWLDEMSARLRDTVGILSETGDYVLMECETALGNELTIIPVLVGESPMPGTSNLPEKIAKLSSFNAAIVRSGMDFRSQMKALIDAIKKAAEASGSEEIIITIRFRNSGKTVRLKDSAKTLLQLAEENGIYIDSSCLAGSCGTCLVGLRSGKVEYDYEPGFKPEEGTCLACVARPVGDVEIDA